MSKTRPPFDGERYRRHLHGRLILGGGLVLLGVGGGLVWLFYGRAAAVTALACLSAAAVVFGLLWLALTLLGRWAKDEE